MSGNVVWTKGILVRNMKKHYVWQLLSIEVMNTTLSSGSWGVDEELLIKDSWSDLLASMTVSDSETTNVCWNNECLKTVVVIVRNDVLKS